MTDSPINGRGLGHVSNFYILTLKNVATASRRCIGVVNKSRRRSACGLHLKTLLADKASTGARTRMARAPDRTAASGTSATTSPGALVKNGKKML